MPQLNFVTWLPYLITCWFILLLVFLLLNNLNNPKWHPQNISTQHTNNSFNWPWS